MRRRWALAVLLIAGGAQAAPTLSLKQLVGTGYITGLQCFAGAQHCEGRTPLAANAFAIALGLPAPTATGQEWWPWDTAGRGWRVQHQLLTGSWTVRLTPLGRRLSTAELRAYPEPKQTWVPRPAPSSGSEQAAPVRGAAGGGTAEPGRSGSGTPSAAPARGTAVAPEESLSPRGTQAQPRPSSSTAVPGRVGTVSRAAGAPSSASAPVCTVVIDVRGLGRMDRDMTSRVLDTQGQQVWPDATLVPGTSSRLKQGGMHTYVTSEAQLAAFQNVTRVKALRLQPPRVAPTSAIRTDAVLEPNAAREFRAAGSACRVVYLLAP